MSELKLISPLLDRIDVGGSISEHHGVRCYPAMEKSSDDKYIVKTISIPPSQTQLDALLLTGAYPDEAAALSYFRELADNTQKEFQLLQRLSQLDGFVGGKDCQIVDMEDRVGCNVYILTPYRRSLERHLMKKPATQLSAVNLGLDLCAALSVCRQAGYLYVDLKPGNIFVSEDRGYRIGDLGFISLKSLKYTSVPEKYCSAYTAPEVQDPFAPLNETLDTYAVGMILYQIYNGGELPVKSTDGQPFAPPVYADYEMAEIILKACDPNPENRWTDPTQMGQALVSYMQRNGANDIPIVSAVTIPAAEEVIEEPAIKETAEEINAPEAAQEAEASAVEAEPAAVNEDAPKEASQELPLAAPQELGEEAEQAPQPAAESAVWETVSEELAAADEQAAPSDEIFENLSFLDEMNADETAPENTLSEVAYEEVSEDISHILAQVDELAAHQIPAPVVAPEAIEVSIPEETAEETIIQEEIAEQIAALDSEAPESAEEESDIPGIPTQTEAPLHEDTPKTKSNAGKILRNIIILLLVAIIGVGAYMYYQYYYLQNIDSVTVEGSDVNLIVRVESSVDESLLSVMCTDSHGTELSAPVVNGMATFANLTPDTAYNIQILVEGFHRLTGDVSASYSTPALTNVVQFNAVTGPEDGSVILGFTVEGPDSGNWSVAYSAEDEAEQTVPLLSHMATLTGLTVGKEYTFTLIPGEEMLVAGMTEISFTASELVYAEDLTILSLVDGVMTVSWNAPEGVDVTNWTVRCYDNEAYNETVITADTEITFSGLDAANSFTVEVTAAGMSVSQRAYIGENAITISDFTVDTSNSTRLTLKWNASREVPEGGWVVLYNVDGLEVQGSITASSNSAVISPMVPNAQYSFTIQAADGSAVLTGKLSCETPKAVDFSGYGIAPKHITYQTLRRPEKENWKRKDVKDSDFTTAFKVGEEISLLVKLSKRYAVYDDNITSLYVIRDEDGNMVCYSHYTRTWDEMWNQYYCEMNVPKVPTEPGSYTMTIYYNGLYTGQVEFTIV